jgi:hypothetical protein
VAVTALGEVVNYGMVPDAAQRLCRLFRKIAAALAPGGCLVFDVLVSGEPPMGYRHWTAGRDWVVLVEVSEPGGGRIVRDITVFREAGAGYRRSEERHTLWVPSAEAVGAWLAGSGFTFTTSSAYGDYPLAARRLAVVARRVAPP